MRYFLSYVESGIHASVMLSTQESLEQPVKVKFEAGFDISGGLQSLFGKQQGFYVQEEAASKAAYSSMPVKHRTYEISEEEAAHFFNLINKDRTKNQAQPLSDEESQIKIMGPQFQLLTNNCKIYALNIFKELGVFEAKSLSNTFFQITRTKKSKMKEINREVLSCPIKDDFIRDFESFANQMKNVLPQAKQLSLNVAFKNTIDDLEKRIEMLQKNLIKLALKKNYTMNINLFLESPRRL